MCFFIVENVPVFGVALLTMFPKISSFFIRLNWFLVFPFTLLLTFSRIIELHYILMTRLRIEVFDNEDVMDETDRCVDKSSAAS